MDKLARFLSQEKPQKILDVCTGAGQFIKLLSTLYSDYEQIIGIDTLDIAVSTSRKNHQEDDRVVIKKMDATHTRYSDDTFDLVTLSNSFHHIEDKKALLEEMVRVAKKGGFILLSEMIADGLTKAQTNHLRIHHFAAEIDRYCGDYHDPTFTSEELIQTIKTMSKAAIYEHWIMTYNHKETTSNDDIEWLKHTIDRMITRISSKQEQQPFIQQGEDIKKDLDQYGFDSATTMIVVMQK
jgi:ubiquinone/menaquinone biosynthesis C-methylase UbiE